MSTIVTKWLSPLILLVLGGFSDVAFGHDASVSKIQINATNGSHLSVILPVDQLRLVLPLLQREADIEQPNVQLLLGDYFTEHLWLTHEAERYDGDIKSIKLSVDKQAGVDVPVIVYSVDIPLEAKKYVLHSDLVQHKVISHKTYVTLSADHLEDEDSPFMLGVLRLKHNDIIVDLSDVSMWQGARSMFIHGIEHILGGADHLLFLICLLLTVPLSVARSAGDLIEKNTSALSHTVGLVSVFTLSHSLALLMTLFLNPVAGIYIELIVTCSVAASALIVVKPRPLGRFDKYALVLGFGFAHGLAFSEVLSELSVSKVEQALELLSFTLGIELVQIVLAILLVPCFVVLSKHQTVYLGLRLAAATFALVASIAWIFEHIQRKPNTISIIMEQAILWLPWLYVLLLIVVLWDSVKANLPSPSSVDRLRN